MSIYLGIRAARKRNSITDHAITSFSIVGLSIPVFVLGTLLILVFAFYSTIFPYGGAYSTLRPPLFGNQVLDQLWHLVLPAITLSFSNIALFTGLTRTNMQEIMRLDYIQSDRASGLSEGTIYYKHALKNAMLPIITSAGIWIGQGIALSPVTETVFTWPGLGYLFVQSLENFDVPLIMAISLILAVMVIVSNLVVDILYAYFDPRLRS